MIEERERNKKEKPENRKATSQQHRGPAVKRKQQVCHYPKRGKFEGH
jgi:hypothetical protein